MRKLHPGALDMTKEEAYLAMAKMIQDEAEKNGDEELALADIEDIVAALRDDALNRQNVLAAVRRKRN
jgi:hypothetical protein